MNGLKNLPEILKETLVGYLRFKNNDTGYPFLYKHRPFFDAIGPDKCSDIFVLTSFCINNVIWLAIKSLVCYHVSSIVHHE